MGKIAFVYHSDYLKHCTRHHPENKYRLIYTLRHLQHSSLAQNLTYITPLPASKEQIQLVHPLSYINLIEKACQGNQLFLDADTAICPDSFRVACLAIGGVIAGVEAVMKGSFSTSFVLLRPPGHHAEREKAMGFCLFNNIAIGARYLQQRYHFKKILIIDFDVHHGNGTQSIFYADPNVFFSSLHQFPFYPGTGNKGERGTGKGKGATLNLPLPAGGGDEEYKKAFQEKLLPQVEKFRPEFILVSAGFDAYQEDPLGGMKLSPIGFKKIGRLIREIAEKYCGGKVVSVLEGGYNLLKLPLLIENYLQGMLSF
jgi:acetoin utilization deacetylase AcuC-like enzyme